MDKSGNNRADERGQEAPAIGGRIGRWLHDSHNLWLIAALIYAVAHLGMLRNGDLRPVLLFLVPPLLAFGILSSPKATRPTRFAAQIFLVLATIAIILAEQPFILQNMKPHFPGVPKDQDRILTFYTGAYLLFIMGFLPPFACGVSLYRHSRGERAALAKPICYLSLVTWLLLLIGLIGNIPRAFKALF